MLACLVLALTAGCGGGGRGDAGAGPDAGAGDSAAGDATAGEPGDAGGGAGTTDLPPPKTLEEAAQRVLGPDDAFIALDPATGEIRALVNPDIAIRGRYPPGSTFKLIVAYALLDGGYIGPHDEVACSGSYSASGTLHPCSTRNGHGSTRIVRALSDSCNVFFYEQGARLGKDRIRAAVDGFKLLEPTGLDPAEPTGLFPDDLPAEQAYLLGAGNLSSLQVTPLNMLVAFAGLVGDGSCRKPWFAERPQRAVRATLPSLFEYQALLMDGLEGAVDHGTATAAAVPGETVLGKTGTVLRADEPTALANWFLGYLVERRLAVCVIHTRAKGVEPAAVAFGEIFESFPIGEPANAATDLEPIP